MLSTPPAFVLSQNQTLHRNVSLIWQTDKLTVVKFCLCSNEITGFQIVISDPETSLVSLINFGDSTNRLTKCRSGIDLWHAVEFSSYGCALEKLAKNAYFSRAASKLITAYLSGQIRAFTRALTRPYQPYLFGDLQYVQINLPVSLQGVEL